MTILNELVNKITFKVDETARKRALDSYSAVSKASDALTKKVQANLKTLPLAQRFDLGQDLSQILEARAQAARKSAAQNYLEKLDPAARSAATGFNLLKTAALGFLGLHIVRSLRDTGAEILELASNAQETQSAMEQSFGPEGAARVVAWSEKVSEEVGRSEFQLQKFAGGLGAILQPMLGNRKQAEELSEAYAKLAVDMGSFFDTSDEDALAALKSGIAGQSEPLLRYGVVLQDATLKEYIRTQGIKKQYKDMTLAEKTQLRFAFTMKALTNAHGDAARTAGHYSNTLKDLEGKINKLKVTIGQAFLPVATKLLRWSADFLGHLIALQKHTKIFQTLLLTGTIFAVGKLALVLGQAASAGTLLSSALSIAKFGLWGVVIAGVVIILSELTAMLTGGRSEIGKWVDAWAGLGTVDATVRNLAAGLQQISEMGYGPALKQAIVGFGDAQKVSARQDELRGQMAAAQEAANSSDQATAAVGRRRMKEIEADGFGQGYNLDRALGRGLDAGTARLDAGRATIGSGSRYGGDVNNITNVVVHATTGASAPEIAKQTADAVKTEQGKQAKRIKEALAPAHQR